MTADRHPRLVERFPEVLGLGEALVAAGLTVAVAESCTGGLLGAVLTAAPGSSRYFRGGVIAYADGVKTALLGVPSRVLESSGAVSETTARLMAEGARDRLGSGMGIAITGIAGPAGGETRKRVGLIHVAVAGPGATAAQRRLEGDHGREANRARAVEASLRLCAEVLAGRK